MATRPQGCKITSFTSSGAVVASTILNKNVYGVTIATSGATAGETISLSDSSGGTVRWTGYVEVVTGTRHYDFGRYGINFPAGIYVNITGASKIVSVVWD